jgi:dienelactone hydrolase
VKVARTAAGVALVALAAGCGGSKQAETTQTRTRTQAPPTTGAAAFADPGTPLAVADRGKAGSAPGVTIRDVSFAGLHGRVQAYLALPAHTRHLPAVILLHGTGGSRSDFLRSAVGYAKRGAVGMTITAPSGATPPLQSTSPLARLQLQRTLAIEDVVAVRRAVDYLDKQAAVDPSRIGLVGWSAGARTGAVVAGVEPRVRWLVLMSGGALPVSQYAAAAPKALRSAIRRTLPSIDPLRWIAKARPGSVYMQDGRADQVVPQPALVALANAAPAGTRVQWYDAGHPLNRAAVRDQEQWLGARLRIGS